MQKDIVLGYKSLARDIEVNQEKIKNIEKLPSPTNVKGVRSFDRHIRFFWCFIKYFSKIYKPLCNLMIKDVMFHFDKDYWNVFNKLN